MNLLHLIFARKSTLRQLYSNFLLWYWCKLFYSKWVRVWPWACVCVCVWGIVGSFYIPSVHHCGGIRLVLHCVMVLMISVYWMQIMLWVLEKKKKSFTDPQTKRRKGRCNWSLLIVQVRRHPRWWFSWNCDALFIVFTRASRHKMPWLLDVQSGERSLLIQETPQHFNQWRAVEVDGRSILGLIKLLVTLVHTELTESRQELMSDWWRQLNSPLYNDLHIHASTHTFKWNWPHRPIPFKWKENQMWS